MTWNEVYYPTLHEENPQAPKVMYTDLECSNCKHHIFPPNEPRSCPWCGELRDDLKRE